MAVPILPYSITNGDVTDAAKAMANWNAIVGVLTGGLDSSNMSASLVLVANQLDSPTVLTPLGLTGGGSTRRGKAIIPGSESRTNTAYGLMPTADRVSNVVLPTDGLIGVLYQATWQESVTDAARATIFLGATQVKRAFASNVNPTGVNASLGGTAAQDAALATSPGGLASRLWTGTGYTGDVTTGQYAGLTDDSSDTGVQSAGPCFIFAAAGTYDVSVQFSAISGSVTAKNRKLWVWTMGF